MAVRAATEIGISEEELLRLGAQDQLIEVIDGEIVEMAPVGLLHHIIAGNVFHVLDVFVRANHVGYVFMDGLIYVLERDDTGRVIQSRVPDASFVRPGRFPADFDLKRPFPGAPDLAVEVISPDERAEKILKKIRDYLAAGTEQVRVLYPDQQELHQHVRGESTVRIYGVSDILTAESLLPGLSITVGDLFAVPDLSK